MTPVSRGQTAMHGGLPISCTGYSHAGVSPIIMDVMRTVVTRNAMLCLGALMGLSLPKLS